MDGRCPLGVVLPMVSSVPARHAIRQPADGMSVFKRKKRKMMEERRRKNRENGTDRLVQRVEEGFRGIGYSYIVLSSELDLFL
jgi:hypothetical protein